MKICQYRLNLAKYPNDVNIFYLKSYILLGRGWFPFKSSMKSFKNDLGYAVYGRVISGLLFITDWQKHDFITIYYKVEI